MWNQDKNRPVSQMLFVINLFLFLVGGQLFSTGTISL